MRFALGISYDGSGFNGWQTQPSGLTVQDTLEQALGSFLDEPIKTTCAGRTDAGVHALGQVVHLDTNKQRSLQSWLTGLNSLLPSSIAVNSVTPVSDTFHARFSAVSRQYIYLIYNHAIPSPFMNNKAGHVRHHLNVDAMQQAALLLLGEHDFSSFRSSQCQANSAIRTITKLQIVSQKPFILLEFTANAFLHHMIRNIVGALIEVGASRKPAEWVRYVLQQRDRTLAAPTFTGKGLYLAKVSYSELLYPNRSRLDNIHMLTGMNFKNIISNRGDY